MEIDEIGTLADALKFGMELEESIREFYEELSEREDLADEVKAVFSEFAEESSEYWDYLDDKHRDACRSDMDMGALEPMSGMDIEDYELDVGLDPESESQDAVKAAIEAEKKASKFYVDIGEETDYISARETKKIADKRDSRISKLESLLE